jgi:hypothetical protein
VTIAFANNQVMVTASSAAVSITTDPVPLGNNDRASLILLVHYAFGGTNPASDQTLSIQPQVSNDGTTWVDVGAFIDVNEAGDTPVQDVRAVQGAYLRYEFTWAIGSGSTGAVCFDVQVKLDHA